MVIGVFPLQFFLNDDQSVLMTEPSIYWLCNFLLKKVEVITFTKMTTQNHAQTETLVFAYAGRQSG